MADEYIKRENVHKSLDDLSSEPLIGNDDDTFISLAKAHDRIEELPVADVVEVVHGCWKGIELKDTCSVCNRSISEICDADSYIEIEVLSELIACPFCGAKMNGERRSENES